MDRYCGTLLRSENLDFFFVFFFGGVGLVVDILFCERIKSRRSSLSKVPILSLSRQLDTLWSLCYSFKKRTTGERSHCTCGIKTEYFELKLNYSKLHVQFAMIHRWQYAFWGTIANCLLIWNLESVILDNVHYRRDQHFVQMLHRPSNDEKDVHCIETNCIEASDDRMQKCL